MKKVILIIASSLLFLSCTKDGKQTLNTDNNEFTVTLLFEVEGCKVYRFKDAGRLRYFTNCNGSATWEQTEGKSSTTIEIPTSKKIK